MTTIYLTILFGIISLSLISELYKEFTDEELAIPTISSKLSGYKERIIENTKAYLKR
jgi:hypothetical protein